VSCRPSGYATCPCHVLLVSFSPRLPFLCYMFDTAASSVAYACLASYFCVSVYLFPRAFPLHSSPSILLLMLRSFFLLWYILSSFFPFSHAEFSTFVSECVFFVIREVLVLPHDFDVNLSPPASPPPCRMESILLGSTDRGFPHHRDAARRRSIWPALGAAMPAATEHGARAQHITCHVTAAKANS